MNELQAWAAFAKSGKITDYLIYMQCRRQGDSATAQRGEAVEYQNAGLDYQGADRGRERPLGDDFNRR